MATVVRRARYLMGTLWAIEAETSDAIGTQRAVSAAFEEIARIERWASRFLPESEVSRINAAAGGAPVACSRELIALLERCRHYTQLTEGAFDVTVGGAFIDQSGQGTGDRGQGEVGSWHQWGLTPAGSDPIGGLGRGGKDGQGVQCQALSDAWGESPELDRRCWVPDAPVGDRHLEIDTMRCRVALRRPGMAVDLGGVAKGYAADRAVAVLRHNDVLSGVVNAGGNLRLFGERMVRSVVIRDPWEPSRVLRQLTLSEAAVATSGNYERAVRGMRGHLVDPATATAASTDALSVTVVADAAETADAYSTALFVMGAERGVGWARRCGVRALIVSSAARRWSGDRRMVQAVGWNRGARDVG